MLSLCCAVKTMASGPSSSLPPEDILVRKLKRPIIQWLQRKLETQIGAAWQDLVDLHDWDYDRITDFENHCASAGKSPFCLLLAEAEFQLYRLCDLKKDLFRLPRKDVLHDLDGIMAKYYKWTIPKVSNVISCRNGRVMGKLTFSIWLPWHIRSGELRIRALWKCVWNVLNRA